MVVSIGACQGTHSMFTPASQTHACQSHVPPAIRRKDHGRVGNLAPMAWLNVLCG